MCLLYYLNTQSLVLTPKCYIMRKRVFIFFLSLVTLTALAKPRDCIIVYLSGGEQVVFPIEGSPQIFFDGKVVTIGDERYQVSNIKKYVIGDSDEQVIDGIESLQYSVNSNVIV